ncbi:MAG: hypothetical protein SCABRO_02543 [Candidatus Scalindua brodae]|uniref:Uncharacterized protein n=1 Tax=Candidatus Scalindua brodae TaxID=237368 RepID=A0A0B0EM28_9BACT|nr:MAG: hypothetical protein SCABRO_02543 [Candidatus Scalindua brodae]
MIITTVYIASVQVRLSLSQLCFSGCLFNMLFNVHSSEVCDVVEDIFEYIDETLNVVQNPIGPHQSQEIDGTYCPRKKLSAVPAIMPVIMPGPVIDRNKMPAKKVARIGPENAEPIMFTISITVDEDFATKKAPPVLKIPHSKVVNFDMRSILSGFCTMSGLNFRTKSETVTADSELKAESMLDIEAAKRPAITRPTMPTGR